MSGLPTLSPLLNVGCSTRPLSRLLMEVRTNAEPLPGLTCWKSTISKGSPSTSILRPLRNSDVSMTPAMAVRSVGKVPLLTPRVGPWASAGLGLELGLHLRGGDAQDVAALAVVAL